MLQPTTSTTCLTASQVRSEDPTQYNAGASHGVNYTATGAPVPAEDIYAAEQRIISDALAILERRLSRKSNRVALTNPRDTGDYLKLQLADRLSECFSVLWLDNRHRVLAFEELFQGTVDGCSVHAREVVRAALRHNACAVVFAHNHPSGVAEPSAADRAITRELRDALQLVGVRTLDHVVIGAGEPVSMAARGLM